jgi:hypothetical protein
VYFPFFSAILIRSGIGDKLVILVEHQSTVNPNMPLRLLMYIDLFSW